MCDAFLVLAQSPKGLSCFLMPRWTPDGERNAVHILRLKDKLGNRSNASSEVEFDGAYAQLIGEEGRGIPTIIEMGNYTRLDCAIGSSGLMRQALAQAVHHARHRVAFQKKLIDQPLMENVLADLALESEAATVLTMRLARAYDEDDEASLAYRRVVTPAAKFWICKRTPYVTFEAMEVLGGSGYIEESVMPRLYREAPVNSIWEGSGNVMCLDVLRALARTPNAAEMLAAELDDGGDKRLAAFVQRLQERLQGAERNDESQARALVRELILALQAALLIKHAPAAVADAFCASRLDGEGGSAFGLLPRGVDARAIIERAAPSRDAAHGLGAPSCPACVPRHPRLLLSLKRDVDGRARARAHDSPCMIEASQLPEHRQHQRHLRQEADRERERAQHRNAGPVDDGVREPRPEIDRAGERGALGRVLHHLKRQHQRREDHQVLDRVHVGALQPLRPGRLRRIVGRGVRPSRPSARAP